MSWRKAQEECNNIGATLIYFLSKTDLNDILQFVKFMKLQTALLHDPEALYIGLKFKVCILVFTKYVSAFFPLTSAEMRIYLFFLSREYGNGRTTFQLPFYRTTTTILGKIIQIAHVLDIFHLTDA